MKSGGIRRLAGCCVAAMLIADCMADIHSIPVATSLVPGATGFQMPVGARGSDVTASLGRGTVTGMDRLEYPGLYVTCDGGAQFSGWYAAVGFNVDEAQGGTAYPDYSKDGVPDFHPGEDWNGVGGGNTDECQPVYPIADGIVLATGEGVSGWGNMLFVVHRTATASGDRFVVSVYAHLRELLPAACVGCVVTRADPVARLGRAGTLYAHLHLEVRNDAFLDVAAGVVQLKQTGAHAPTAWPAADWADQGHWFIGESYCEPSFLIRHGVCEGDTRPEDVFVSYVVFAQGNPGVPGDGVLVGPGVSPADVAFDVAAPLPIDGLTGAYTVSVYPAPGEPIDVIQTTFGVRGVPAASGCSATIGGTPARAAPPVNGVPGFAIEGTRSMLKHVAALIDARPDCDASSVDELQLESLAAWRNSGKAHPEPSDYVRRVDAVAVGSGRARYPTASTPAP